MTYAFDKIDITGLKPTNRNSELIFRKRNPLAVFLGSRERVQCSNNQFIIAFFKRPAGSSFK